MENHQPLPTTRAERILAELRNCPDGATGAELTRRLELRPQSVNSVCRKLADGGFITRTKEDGLLVNRLLPIGDGACIAIGFTAGTPRPWFWEGNVQARVVEALCERGWTITWQADTASHQPGKDIKAARDGAVLWVTVKGFPVGTPKTKPTVQARHLVLARMLRRHSLARGIARGAHRHCASGSETVSIVGDANDMAPAHRRVSLPVGD